jgi:hypothetical protein
VRQVYVRCGELARLAERAVVAERLLAAPRAGLVLRVPKYAHPWRVLIRWFSPESVAHVNAGAKRGSALAPVERSKPEPIMRAVPPVTAARDF